MIEILDHRFVNHKSVEMICWQCGYVIWRCKDSEEVDEAIQTLAGTRLRCGKAWHVTIPVP
jgi:hypothetical protein